MIIYIEGVDGSGKSTLKDRLVKRLEQVKNIHGVTIFPEGETLIPTRPQAPNRITKVALARQLLKMASDPDVVYILDRGPLSDIIYRGFDDYEPVLTLDMFSLLWNNFPMSVMVHCTNKNAEEYMLSRGEDNPTSLNHHKALTHFYNQILPLFNAIKYDFTEETDDKLTTINTILARLWAGLARHRHMEEVYTTQTAKLKEAPKNDKA